ncbi:MAG: HAD family hydrolase [Candidatus Omnitrophica bacterium]|nr:HAD family hydrolase [Candidatus Omnitrophota bacterium]MBU4487673.1 HAD family hydrolase [Candidatus Omnitrophota bacterium]
MQKVIFIDRDGVINKDPGGWTKYSYVTKWEDFLFIDGSIRALKLLKDAGYKVFLISNQGGISKGYFTQKDLDVVNKKMLLEIEKGGGKIDSLFYCPHHDKDNCECRKPKTGLIEKAAKDMHIDFKNTCIIGDAIGDIEAGKRMGMKTIFVASGKTSLSELDGWSVKPDYIKQNLLEAVEWILRS